MSAQNAGQLAGKVAVVTGAASGIGQAIAVLFAAEGAALALCDLSTERLAETSARCEAAGATVSAHAVDVTDSEAVRAVMDAVVATHGGIQVLVNSAGILDETPLLEMSAETFDRTIAVDLTGIFTSCRWAAPVMVAGGGGRIINIASQLGIKGGVGLTHYAAAKAGVIGFTKSLALELAPHGVLANVIAPGPIFTPLVEGLSAEWKAAKQAELPLGRFGYADEVAPTALLLASDPGGNLYTGQTLGPNSGDVMP
ncbi:SDR family NAD(P)-dependent oxidoreductase [Klugiella xanthotipulae]|uniref:3-oxoacyl-[acyl-carrier protein] reductase n=1 Tax=Klugiella xanthotipulae TaxID=244735 RepID=A0A543HY73_9MICO|nr:SDR family NAD(P)-dependent oxidoreductase [Klugiella xanthotipulae]TQM63281.1 3-oxoacyl-[acyl-carrier protein] reductase [Klugiella xanthotipulae]